MTFGEMTQDVVERMGGQYGDAGSADLQARAARALNSEYRLVRGRRPWSWLVTYIRQAILATDILIPVPAGCRTGGGIMSVGLVSLNYNLERSDWLVEQAKQGSAYLSLYRPRGTPESYCQIGKYILIDPLPANDDSLDIWFLSNGVDLVAATDVPLMDEIHQGILPAGATMRLSAQDSMDSALYKQSALERQEYWIALCHAEASQTPLKFMASYMGMRSQ